jgi:hypothetical protein
MPRLKTSTLTDDLTVLYCRVDDQLARLDELAFDLQGDQDPPWLTPDLTEVTEEVRTLADRLAIANVGHLVNSVKNIEQYLIDDPGAAQHHIRELRRRLLFRRWPIARDLHELVQDVSVTKQLLESCPLDHVTAVIADVRRSRHFKKYVPVDHQPRLVAHCIEAGILYGDDEKSALRSYLEICRAEAACGATFRRS